MKRSVKNILFVVLILLFGFVCFFYMKMATNEVKHISENTIMENKPPEIPSGDVGGKPPELPPDGGEGMPPDNMNKKIEIDNIYYVTFFVDFMVISILILLLILSEFNKKKLKDVISKKRNIVIILLGSVIIAGSFTYFCYLFIDKYAKSSFNINSMEDDIIYNSVFEITDSNFSTLNKSFVSSSNGENVILVRGNVSVSLKNIELNKTGDFPTRDVASFYGVNSTIVVKDKAKLALDNINISSDAKGANGVFCYGGDSSIENVKGDGSSVTISNSKIVTKGENSGGIMVTGDGNMTANNVSVNTYGDSSASIRTDRGGGTLNVNGGDYTTFGNGSPAIYSTGNILVNNATLVSNISEGVVIDGSNSVTLNNCKLTSSNTKLNGQSTNYVNVRLYRSVGTSLVKSSFTATDSVITTNNGDSFYVTNTSSIINLNNNTIVNNDKNGYFLRAKEDTWGKSGTNGGNVTLNLSKQQVFGNIYIDSISTLDMSILNNSYYEGMINNSNLSKSISLKLDKSSRIKLTGDSYIYSLDNEDTTNGNIIYNGYKLYVNGISISE